MGPRPIDVDRRGILYRVTKLDGNYILASIFRNVSYLPNQFTFGIFAPSMIEDIFQNALRRRKVRRGWLEVDSLSRDGWARFIHLGPVVGTVKELL